MQITENSISKIKWPKDLGP